MLAVAKHPDADASRVIQGVITGVGFLGTGVILHRPTGSHVENLTTAAAIWITAALGVLSALGDWSILLIAVILTFFLLIAGARVENRLRQRLGSDEQSGPTGSP